VAGFVGRTAELAGLCSWADEAAATGVGRFVLVTGEAGLGKTRLCAEFSRRLATAGVAVAWSRCWLGGGPPLWPWPDLLAELAHQRQVSLECVAADAARDRFGLFRAVSEQLRALCASGPAVALIDDLHAANRDVVLLTRFVARSLHRFPLLLVATWRVERPAPADSTAALNSLARDATTVDLGPFGTEEVSAYLRALGRSDVAPDAISQLLAFTGGSPMYLAELVSHPLTNGAAAGGALAAALARRVAGLAPAQRQILGAAALLGDGATVGEAAQILGCPMGDVVAAIDDLASGAAVVDGRIQFSHELLRDAFLAALPTHERQRLHVAATRTICGVGADQVARRAHHAVEATANAADQRASAAAVCAEAAAALQRALAFEQAAEWAAKGVALAIGTSSPAREAELLLAHADAVLACGRLAEARELYGKASGAADRAGDPRLLALAALGLGGVWVEEQRDEMSRRRMLGMCRRALAELPADEPLLAARLRVRLAAEHAYGGAAVEDVRAAVDHARRFGDPAATAEALSLYHHTLLLPGHARTRLDLTDELLDAATQAEGTIYALFGLCWRTVDLYHLGDPDADRVFVDLRDRATALASESIGYIVAVLEVMRTFRRGGLDRAEAAAGEALRIGLAVGDADALAYYGAHLLAIRWVQGRLGEMLETITSVMDSLTLRRRDRVYPALLAYATALRGDHAAARCVLDGLLADGVAGIPDFSTFTATVAVLVETAAELGDGDLATELAERFAPYAHLPVMPSLAVICLGPGERILGVAHCAAGRLDDAIKWFRAALDANRRLGSRPFDAVIRAQLAAALCRRGAPGDREAAADLYATAIGLGRELGLSGRLPDWEAAAAVFGGGAHRAVEPLRGVLERRDGSWYVEIGSRAATIDQLVGMRHVAELLARPDTDIAATELSAALANGGAGIDVTFRAQPALDDRAVREYRRRLGELDRELDAADLTGDAERARQAADERAFILDQLRRDTGLGGRPRRLPDDVERARMRVSKAIHRAIRRLSSADPVLGRALETGVRTGYLCRYVTDPGQPISWTVRA
jgi:tetratricopeptide (TPR) repeat protein